MDNDIDVVEQLRIKNHELYINKLIIDLENAIESLIIFYNNYCDTISGETKNITSVLLDNKTDISEKQMNDSLLDSFFSLFKEKVSQIFKNRLGVIKSNIQNIDAFNYEKKLNNESLIIVNQVSDYYQENILMLIDEIKENFIVHQLEVREYLQKAVYIKLMNTLKDKLIYSIKLINNNYDENTTMLQSINEKTLK